MKTQYNWKQKEKTVQNENDKKQEAWWRLEKEELDTYGFPPLTQSVNYSLPKIGDLGEIKPKGPVLEIAKDKHGKS